MAERERKNGDIQREPATWDFWTGDIWKIIPTLKKYRPDLTVLMFDCPPTGLLLLANLNAYSTALQDNYDQIVAEHRNLLLDSKTLREIWNTFPMIDTSLSAAL
jgi:hypothetical protein